MFYIYEIIFFKRKTTDCKYPCFSANFTKMYSFHDSPFANLEDEIFSKGIWIILELFSVCRYTVQILCIGTDRSQQTVQTKIRLLLKKQSDQGLRCLPFHQHLLDALMQCYIKLFYFLGQLWQLFEVSQILEFLR